MLFNKQYDITYTNNNHNNEHNNINNNNNNNHHNNNQWPRALFLLGGMRSAAAPNLITYNSALSACEASGKSCYCYYTIIIISSICIRVSIIIIGIIIIIDIIIIIISIITFTEASGAWEPSLRLLAETLR